VEMMLGQHPVALDAERARVNRPRRGVEIDPFEKGWSKGLVSVEDSGFGATIADL